MKLLCVLQPIFFSGEVIALTSGYTISAAETFLQAMAANPNNKLTIVGEKTAGFYSDALKRSLPSDFSYALSNELYYDHNNILLEGHGIDPQVNIPLSMSSIDEGRDDAYDWLLKLVAKRKSEMPPNLQLC